MPKPNPGWPVSYEDACDVVSALHDQLDDAHNEITKLERQLAEAHQRCPVCGERDGDVSHKECQ